MYTVDIKSRKFVNIVASNYLCEREDGEDYFDSYLRLVDAIKKDNGVLVRSVDGVYVTESVENFLAKEITELIEAGVNQHIALNNPNVTQNIDWSELRKQKKSLLYIISVLQCNNDNDSEHGDNLTGILHLVDAIQDHAVDINCVDKDIVFGIEEEE